MPKRWLKFHTALHCVTSIGFLGTWYVMVHMLTFMKPRCSTFPFLVEKMYLLSNGVVFFALLPLGMFVFLITKRNISESRKSRYWSSVVLFFGFAATAFLGYVGYLPVFDCGLGVPLEYSGPT